MPTLLLTHLLLIALIVFCVIFLIIRYFYTRSTLPVDSKGVTSETHDGIETNVTKNSVSVNYAKGKSQHTGFTLEMKISKIYKKATQGDLDHIAVLIILIALYCLIILFFGSYAYREYVAGNTTVAVLIIGILVLGVYRSLV